MDGEIRGSDKTSGTWGCFIEGKEEEFPKKMTLAKMK